MREMRHLRAERPGIDRADHLAEHLCLLAIDGDLRMEGRGEGRPGSWTNHHCREGEQIVGLDDHAKAATALHVAAPARQLDLVNVTANHATPP